MDWSETSPRHIEKIALSLHTKYCTEIAPTQLYTGVEVTHESLQLPDLGLEITGTIDRERLVNGKHGIADLKSGKNVVNASGEVDPKKHYFQMGVYELLYEVNTGIVCEAPAGILGMNTAAKPENQRIGFVEVAGAKHLLIGTEENPGLLEMAAKIIGGGLFYGNPRSMFCSKKICPIYDKCRYRGAN